MTTSVPVFSPTVMAYSKTFAGSSVSAVTANVVVDAVSLEPPHDTSTQHANNAIQNFFMTYEPNSNPRSGATRSGLYGIPASAAMAAEAGIPYKPLLVAPDLGFEFGS